MKIAQICPAYYPSLGGIQTHVKEISQRLVKRGFEVDVLTTDANSASAKTEQIIEGVNVIRFKSFAPSNAFYFSNALRYYLQLNAYQYDILHAHAYAALPALYAAQTKQNKKLVFTPHFHEKSDSALRNILHVGYRFVGKKIFESADCIICVSSYEQKLLQQKFSLNASRFHVIPDGVEIDQANLERKSTSGRTVLYVGRLKKYKGIHYVIEAIAKLNEETIFEVVGKGNYAKRLTQLTQKLGVVNRVRFYENLPRGQLLERYASADLFVLLSTQEAFGISVAEALAAGIPCIVANSSALTEWVDNENCYAINLPVDVDQLAKLIDTVVGKKIVPLKLQSWDDVVNQLVKVYCNLLSDGR